MPRPGFFRKRMVKIRKDELPAAQQGKKNEVAQRGGKYPQYRLGGMCDRPADGFQK